MDDFVKDLQNQIFDETRMIYGEVAFQRWLKPLYVGRMEDPGGSGRVTGSCGDTIEMFLKITGDKVQEALFQTDGCGSSLVCGSFAAELATGKTIDELVEITGEKILGILGKFPEEDQHCAFLAAEALQEALNNYMLRRFEREKP